MILELGIFEILKDLTEDKKHETYKTLKNLHFLTILDNTILPLQKWQKSE